MMNVKMLFSAILFGGLVVSAPVEAFSFKYDPDFQKKLAEFEIACQMVGEKMENQEIVSEPRMFRSPQLVFADEASRQAFQNYKERLHDLWSQLLYNAAGDGFLLGLLASAIQHGRGVKLTESNVGLGLCVSVGVMIMLQNQYLKTLSYYDQNTLKPKNGLFKWWRWFVAWTAAEAGLAGMNAIINRKCL